MYRVRLTRGKEQGTVNIRNEPEGLISGLAVYTGASLGLYSQQVMSEQAASGSSHTVARSFKADVSLSMCKMAKWTLQEQWQ